MKRHAERIAPDSRRWRLRFITCSCYRRQPFLGSVRRRDLFLKILEEVRKKYNFIVVGYVVMPEHFHMLVGEPKTRPLSVMMQVLKQRVSQKCRRRRESTPDPGPLNPLDPTWSPD